MLVLNLMIFLFIAFLLTFHFSTNYPFFQTTTIVITIIIINSRFITTSKLVTLGWIQEFIVNVYHFSISIHKICIYLLNTFFSTLSS